MQSKWLARIEQIKTTRARTMALRREADALASGLGDAVMVAKTIAERKKELNREFKNSPLKGTRHQSTVHKRIQKRMANEAKELERQVNPRLRGLANVPGVEVDEDGTIGLKDLREQRPDLFEMQPMGIEGKVYGEKRRRIAIAATNRGKRDKYEYLINNKPEGSGPVPAEAEAE